MSETNATGNGVLGGLIGSIASGTVDSSVALGSVSGGEYCECGGAIGAASTYSDEPSARVTNTVSYGAVKAALSDEVGGFIGYDGTGNDGNNGLLASDRWDMTTSGINDPSQGAGNIPNDPGITGFN